MAKPQHASREKMSKKTASGGSRSSATSGAGIGMADAAHSPQPPYGTAQKGIKMTDEQRMRAEDDMRTLHRTHQIITDKPRHAAAKQIAGEIFAAAQAPGVSVSGHGSGKTYGGKVK